MNRYPSMCFFVILILLFAACGQKDAEEQKPVLEAKDTSIVKPNIEPDTLADTIPVDSIFLDRLETAFTNRSFLTHYADSTTDAPENHEYRSVVRMKLNLNGDPFEDYVVLYDHTHFVEGAFFDGRTGRLIPSGYRRLDEAMLFFHRPYPDQSQTDLELEVVDLNCGDGQDELMVLYPMGPSPGESGFSTYLLLYRFDKDSSKVDLIFNQLVLEDRSWGSLADTSKDYQRSATNYLEVLYSSKECMDTITVQEGVCNYKTDHWLKDWRKANIKPKKGSPVATYIFNADSNKFQLSAARDE